MIFLSDELHQEKISIVHYKQAIAIESKRNIDAVNIGDSRVNREVKKHYYGANRATCHSYHYNRRKNNVHFLLNLQLNKTVQHRLESVGWIKNGQLISSDTHS